MNGFLLDTNCVSEVVCPRPDPKVLAWMEAADERLLYLSVLTLGEIRKGAAALPQGKRRTRLEVWLQIELPTRFSGRILAIDTLVADRWGQLAAEAKQCRKTLPVIDGLLAATALQHNLTIVTRNTEDFTHAHVPVLNPWNT
jgi:predicted nucleic acid-binding protein